MLCIRLHVWCFCTPTILCASSWTWPADHILLFFIVIVKQMGRLHIRQRRVQEKKVFESQATKLCVYLLAEQRASHIREVFPLKNYILTLKVTKMTLCSLAVFDWHIEVYDLQRWCPRWIGKTNMIFLNIRNRDATSKQVILHISLYGTFTKYLVGRTNKKAVGQFHMHTHTCERVCLQDGNEKLWLSGSCVDRVHLN